MDIAQTIDDFRNWRKQKVSKTRGDTRRISTGDLDKIFANQHPVMKDHLKHDNTHRMLDRYKACARTPYVEPDRKISLD